MAEDPSNGAETKNINKDVIEAVNLLAHGKRNILCGEISQAVTQLQEACRILGAEYGELADECADAYLWYGKALLELSRLESGVLGDAIPGVESEDSENSGDETSDDQSSTKEENGTEDDEQEDGVMSEDLEEDEENKEQNAIGAGDDAVNGTKSTDKANVRNSYVTSETGSEAIHNTPDGDKDEEESKDVPSAKEAKTAAAATAECDNSERVAGSSKSEVCDTEEISNLQLAWEMLELSKIIYQRHDRNDMKLKLAETYLRLGEIGMETEQYDQAINDLTQCLNIQRNILEPEDRRLAETLYQLGLACTYSRQYDSAVRHYGSAIAVIQAKIDRLAKVVAGEIPPDPVENGDGFYSPLELAQKEIVELKELLPDISAKIDDVRDEQGEAEKVKILMQETVTSSALPSTPGGCDGTTFNPVASTSAAPVNNVSHLVRKKRKSEDNPKQQSDPAKRVKTTLVADPSSSALQNTEESSAKAFKTETVAASNNQEFQDLRQKSD